MFVANSTTRRQARQAGLTLVEVLVVVAIASVIAMMSASFGMHWSNTSKVTQTQATLQQSYAIAKATALQNHLGNVSREPAATMCMSASQVVVYQGSACAGNAVWTRPLSAGVAIEFGTPAAAATCLALTNAAIPVAAAGSQTCTTNLNYRISAGNANASKTLY